MATKKALQSEAENKDTVFVYDNEKYTIPPARLWPLEVVEAQEDGKLLACIKALLGADQYKLFKSKPRTMGDLEDLMVAAFDAVEADPKE